MNTIITKEESIHSCDDFELNIKRENQLSYKYSYPDSKELKGIVFIVAGFGEDTNSDYIDKLRTYIADTFSVVAVNVFYHCFYSRPENGAIVNADVDDMQTLKAYANHEGISYGIQDTAESLLTKINAVLQTKKDLGEINEQDRAAISMTIFPKHGEYQNFGIMQALDHLNVLNTLEKKSFNFQTDYSVTMMGSSHGGYISYLCAKLAPHRIDCVIDNSSYVKPPYNYFLGKEYDASSAEYHATYQENIILYCFVKTNWTLDKNSKNYFSNDRYRIRDISDQEHLQTMGTCAHNRTRYISYHSSKDAIAPIEDKINFFNELQALGFDVKLHIIDNESYVEGRFIKNLHHGMDMSLKELANRELPGALNIKNKKSKTKKISYTCDTLAYEFEIKDDSYVCKQPSLHDETKEETLYLDNISYFQENHPHIYNKLAALDAAIEQKLHKSRYELMMKDTYYDVLEIVSGNYLYGSNSNEYADIAAQSITFKTNENVFETFKKTQIQKQNLQKYAKESILDNNLSGLAPILHYINENKPPHSELKTIDKFIFFGVGLGGHLLAIDKKIHAKVYFIIEDDLELFRLSLFTTPYYKLASKSQLIFSVFDTAQEFSSYAFSFLEKRFYNNHYLKYFQMLNHSDDKLKEFHIKVASQSHNLFYYNAILKQYLRPLEYLQDNFKFLNILKLYTNPSLDSRPFLLLAAGPSLHKNIQWLKQNHTKFITVALSATLSILEQEGIAPDIVTHIDGLEESIIHFDKLKSLNFFKNSIFLISARTLREIVERLDKENIFFFENGTSYKKDFGNLSAPCVGSTTYLLLLALGIKELYLLGLDLALDSATGATHATGHEYSQTLDLKLSDTHEDILTFKDSVIKTLGNFRNEVYTTPDFMQSIDSINASSKSFKRTDQNVYNLNDGAKFENTITLDIDALNTQNFADINKTVSHTKIHEIFSLHSSNRITDDEFTGLKERLDNAIRIQEIIIAQQHSLFDSSVEFLDSLVTISDKLTYSTSAISYDLALVYQEYFRFIYTFIFDFFNTDKTDKKIHVDEINKLLCTQLMRIVHGYKEELENILLKDTICKR
ncbi:DUF2920 family protein [bacterium]|nr:DUF2920 family protein [bacterium]MBU1990610.1 DUF2920 family protein [bacterium]